MRILLVTGIFPPDIGGPATYIPRLGEALGRKHEVQVVTLGDAQPGDLDYPFTLHRVARTGGA